MFELPKQSPAPEPGRDPVPTAPDVRHQRPAEPAPPRTAAPRSILVHPRTDRPGRDVRDEVRRELRAVEESGALLRLRLALQQARERDDRTPGPALSQIPD
ncbi:hypothetical protein [Pseudonocardia sp. NPDC049635]|uniref:hypothetical protein n=1 Tax=Pseudonocardia sp. NPDC049635 TaxID=3155506 RepID=UPI0033F8B674